jgi:signal peptidase II
MPSMPLPGRWPLTERPRLAGPGRRAAGGGLALALGVLAFDQASKLWLIGFLAGGPAIELTPFLNLVLVWNRGVSFGMLGAADFGPWPFVALSAVIVAGLAIWLWRLDRLWLALAVGAVIGGALGNVVDRIAYGAVADFLDFHLRGYHWPAFNVADSAIVIGVAAIVLEAFTRRRPGAADATQVTETENGTRS